jgi:hypothetical protein
MAGHVLLQTRDEDTTLRVAGHDWLAADRLTLDLQTDGHRPSVILLNQTQVTELAAALNEYLENGLPR